MKFKDILSKYNVKPSDLIKAGVPASSIWKYHQGLRTPKLPRLVQISAISGIPMEELVCVVVDEKSPVDGLNRQG